MLIVIIGVYLRHHSVPKRGQRLLAAAYVLCALLCVLPWQQCRAAGKTLSILSTTFPVYQITRNVAAGVPDVTVSLLIPAGTGCPHDYALTPEDMRALATADVLVINGLGMEEFLGAPLQAANPRLALIDSSQGIRDLLPAATPLEEDEHGHEHAGSGLNAHLYSSPRMSALLAGTIAEDLARRDPAHAALYTENARKYGQRMEKLAHDFSALGQTLHKRRIVIQHESFSYLARDMGLEVVAVLQGHAGEDASASELLHALQAVREKQAGAVFIEPQYSGEVGRMIASEAHIPVALLDPMSGGPPQVSLDYYDQVMRNNLRVLKETLGHD